MYTREIKGGSNIEKINTIKKEISIEDNWEYTFKLPKYDRYGKIITYEIDEIIVPAGYTKTIEGNTITNTLIIADSESTNKEIITLGDLEKKPVEEVSNTTKLLICLLFLILLLAVIVILKKKKDDI